VQLAQATTFPDIQGNWAQSFIEALAARGVIRGFPDGTFRPDEPVTRAQFAAMIRQAFQRAPKRSGTQFVDVPAITGVLRRFRKLIARAFWKDTPTISLFLSKISLVSRC
jgi:hypothetical protein